MSRRGRRINRKDVKDGLWFVLGWSMIAYQTFVVPPPDFNLWVVISGAVVAGVPGALPFAQRLIGGGPSSSAEGPPPPPSSSSSSAVSGAEQ